MVLRDADPENLEDDDDEQEQQKGTKASTPNKKKKKYPQKYRRAWEQDRSWLTEQDGLAYCRACNKQLGNNISRLIRHEQTTKHKRRKEQVNFEVATIAIESVKSERSRKSSPLEKISYYSADEQDDNESSVVDNLLKPVITKVEVVKEDKAPNSKKRRDTIIPSSFRYKVDDAGEDEFDVIGKNVANKLRKLAPDTQMYAEKLVMDVIFQAQIGNIYKNSVLQIINCESQQSSSQPSSSVQSDCQIAVNIASLPNSTPKNMTNFE